MSKATVLAAAVLLAGAGAVHPADERDGRLAETAASLTHLSRSPAAILAEGGSLRDVAHTALLRDMLRDRAAALAAPKRTPPPPALPAEAGKDETLDRLATLAGPMPRPDRPASRERPFRFGLYRLPISGKVVTGTGEQDPSGGRARGLTLATAPDRPVLAPAAGRVRYAAPFRVYGDVVILDHGHGWTSLVAGLDRSVVAPGDDLRLGDPIGRSGQRLIVELRHNGRPVDVAAMIWLLGR